MEQVRARAGGDKVILTESNAEPFMDAVNVFLTLVGFSHSNQGTIRTVPVFQSAYGGYYLAAGAEYFANDFAPNPDLFSAKLAHQFLYGAQMGWFSLGGRDNQSPYMGIYDQLMDPAHDPEILYLQRLSGAKVTARRWLTHGRAMRAVPLLVNGTRPLESAAIAAVPSQAWLSSDGKELLIAITTVERYAPAFSLELTIDVSLYGFPGAGGEAFEMTRLQPGGGSTAVGKFTGSGVHFKGELAAREVLLLVVARA